MDDEERRQIREKHRGVRGRSGATVCATCRCALPCTQIRTLDELEQVEAVVREATDHYEAVMARQEEPAECWRHADGSVRTDHMDTRPGDYFGAARQEEGTRADELDAAIYWRLGVHADVLLIDYRNSLRGNIG